MLGCLVVALCLGAPPARADVFDDACAYFEARALGGAGNSAFREHLSRECGAALTTYRSAAPGSEPWRMAGSVLGKMQEFRVVLDTIPRIRLARSLPPEIVRDAPLLLQRPVSASGEVLIARVIGVTPQLSAWENWRLSRR